MDDLGRCPKVFAPWHALSGRSAWGVPGHARSDGDLGVSPERPIQAVVQLQALKPARFLCVVFSSSLRAEV